MHPVFKISTYFLTNLFYMQAMHVIFNDNIMSVHIYYVDTPLPELNLLLSYSGTRCSDSIALWNTIG